jgi:hypothetical protein
VNKFIVGDRVKVVSTDEDYPVTKLDIGFEFTVGDVEDNEDGTVYVEGLGKDGLPYDNYPSSCLEYVITNIDCDYGEEEPTSATMDMMNEHIMN